MTFGERDTELDDQSVDDLLAALQAVRDEKRRGRELEKDILEALHDRAKTAGLKKQFDSGAYRVKLSHSINRKWDVDELIRHVVSRALDERAVNAETGEIEPSWAAVTRAIKECAHIDYFRLGAVKDRGLDPDEFYEETSRSLAAQITLIISNDTLDAATG